MITLRRQSAYLVGWWILLGCILCTPVLATPAENYLKKFQTYTHWSENLPSTPQPEFLSFIEKPSPLTNKLRKKWLYKLAKNKDWETFALFYKPSSNIELQCHMLTALYHLGSQAQAIEKAKSIWLSGSSRPSACDEIFKQLLLHDQNPDALITQRIRLALKKRNVSLAIFLLKKLSPPRIEEATLLAQIHHNPSNIAKLKIQPLHDDFYLYGLKRMISKNMDQAIQYWQHVKTEKLLSEAQQQEFLVRLSIYKAMRNQEDAPLWFAKVRPQYYTDAFLDWRIRFALKQKNWKEVERLIQLNLDRDDLRLQYWLARSLESQGKKDQAKALYEVISQNRNYYGFLASLRLNKQFTFEHENVNQNMKQLAPYQPLLNEIKSLYQSNQTVKAARIIHDFALELPKDERSILAYWLATELNWYEKALYLSNNHELHDQIALRFPLAYQDLIAKYAQKNNLPSEFVYAVIRQESAFRKHVVSHAGAYGLMQLLPKTAKQVSRKERIAVPQKAQLFSPPVNIRLGTAYLKQLGKRFHQHPLLIAAAYNAGPRQVNYWLKNHPPKEIDIWIETLPWQETRNYLKNVMAFYAVYQYRLGEKPDLSLFMKRLQR